MCVHQPHQLVQHLHVCRLSAPGCTAPEGCIDGNSLACIGPSPHPDIEAFITSMCTQVLLHLP